jgi:hypothetical protein
MSEFEDSIRDTLRGAGPADESFVSRIDSRIEAHEQRRMIGLALAAAAAIALITLMAVGIGLIGPALVALLGLSMPGPPSQALSILGVTAPVAGLLLLAALAFPFVRSRK